MTTMKRSADLEDDLRAWTLVWFLSSIIGSVVASLLWQHHFSLEGMDAVLRATGRFSLPIFWLCYLSRDLLILFPAPFTRWLAGNRKYLGLSFAVVYLFHFAAVLGVVWFTGHPGISGFELVLSIVALVCVVAMTITSFDQARAKLSPQMWSNLHGFGMFSCWLFFTLEYLHLMEENGPLWFFLPIVSLCLSVMPLKIMSQNKKKIRTA